MQQIAQRASSNAAGDYSKHRVFLHSSLLYLVERIFGIGLAFGVYAALARTYGPVSLGEYSFVQAVMLFAVPFLGSGSEGIIVRELVRNGSDRGAVLGSSLVVLSATGILSGGILLAGMLAFQGDHPRLVSMAFFTSLGYLPSGFLLIEHNFRARHRAVAIVAARTVSALAAAAVKLYLIFHSYPIETIVFVTAVETFSLAALFVALLRPEDALGKWRYSGSIARRLFRLSVPGMIASVIGMLLYRSNHLMLAYLADFTSVGQYALAYQTAQMFMVLPTVVCSAIYPKLVELFTLDRGKYRTVVDAAYYLFTLAGYLIVLFCIFTIPPFFHLIFGEKFDVAGQVLIVLCICNVFTFSSSVRGRAIDISGKTNCHLVAAAVGLVCVLPVSWLLIPHYGAVGAACSITFASFVANVLVTLAWPQFRGDGITQLRSLLLVPPANLVSDLRPDRLRP